jgi:hypothetical protein
LYVVCKGTIRNPLRADVIRYRDDYAGSIPAFTARNNGNSQEPLAIE